MERVNFFVAEFDIHKTALDRVFEEVENLFLLSEQQFIKITRITPIVLKKWTETWKPYNHRQPPNGGWDWVYKKTHFTSSSPLLFDMAIWGEKDVLCGLALGKFSRSAENLSIYYLEGNPDKKHILKGWVLGIIVETALEYAKLKGSREVKIIEPVANLIPVYQQYGFQMQRKWGIGKVYCAKEIKK